MDNAKPDEKKSKVVPKHAPAKPEKLDPADLARIEAISLKRENAQLKIGNLRLLLEILDKEDVALHQELKVKYQLEEGDHFDPQTLAVVRKK